MKTIILILTAALVITLTACNQKTDLAAKATEASMEVTQKVQEPAQQAAGHTATATKTAVKEVAEVGKDSATKSTAAEVAEAGKDSAVKSVPVVKETAEQALAATSDAARELTKTQVSESRQRAQNAEDEMKMELAKRK